jgi:hypothetical protein
MEFDHKGYVFTKKHILKALHVGHAAVGTDNQTIQTPRPGSSPQTMKFWAPNSTK